MKSYRSLQKEVRDIERFSQSTRTVLFEICLCLHFNQMKTDGDKPCQLHFLWVFFYIHTKIYLMYLYIGSLTVWRTIPSDLPMGMHIRSITVHCIAIHIHTHTLRSESYLIELNLFIVCVAFCFPFHQHSSHTVSACA